MTVPARTTMFAAIMLAVVLLAGPFDPALKFIVLLADAALIGLCVAGGRRLDRLSVSVDREEWKRLQINRESEFIYRIENRSSKAVHVFVRQPWPASFDFEMNSLEVYVGGGEVVRVMLTATPRMRGRIEMPAAEIDIRFPSGWARYRWDLEDVPAVSVFPDLQSLYEYDVLRRHRALQQFGIHRLRMIGAGREFEQLREYLPDDDYRDVNWKATARRRKPITNVYQAERSQDVLLCLDCGRMMGNPVGTGTALDRAIDASILLAHAANRQQDRVGLILFRDTVNLFLKPRTGLRAVNRIIEELVDVTPEGVFPSYASLVSTLRRNQKRRCMVFLFTDLNDPQLAADLSAVLRLLSRRHVFVVVSLRDPLLDRIASGPAHDARDLYRVLAARQLATERDSRSRELINEGVGVLEAHADAITIEVINRYLAIKTRQLL